MLKTLIALLVVIGSINAFAADANFRGLESLMVFEEQRAAG